MGILTLCKSMLHGEGGMGDLINYIYSCLGSLAESIDVCLSVCLNA